MIIPNSFAQKDLRAESAYNFYSEKSGDFPPALVSNNNAENISKKTLKNFSRQFHNASDVKWEKLDDNSLATFVNGGTTTKSLFDEKGKLLYTINFFANSLLPNYMKKMINSKYKNYQIITVKQVLMENHNVWVIMLSGTSNYVTTRIEDDDMQEIANIRRAN